MRRLAILEVNGMHCTSCSSKIKVRDPSTHHRAFTCIPHSAATPTDFACPNVCTIDISLDERKASIEYETGDVLTAEQLASQITLLGFASSVLSDSAVIMRSTLIVDGMHCTSCSSKIERTLGAMTGVESIAVTLAPNRAVVAHDSSLSAPQLASLITDLGFRARAPATARFVVDGMHCRSCTGKIEVQYLVFDLS